MSECVSVYLSHCFKSNENIESYLSVDDVRDVLGPAVGESNLVGTVGVVAITALLGVEVGERVVVLDSVPVLVDGGEVWVGRLRGVGGDGGGGEAESRGGERSGQKSLRFLQFQ